MRHRVVCKEESRTLPVGIPGGAVGVLQTKFLNFPGNYSCRGNNAGNPLLLHHLCSSTRRRNNNLRAAETPQCAKPSLTVCSSVFVGSWWRQGGRPQRDHVLPAGLLIPQAVVLSV